MKRIGTIESGPGDKRPRGRPRAFDPQEALQQAMCVFWRRGFEGASLPELTKAMGINRPSMYAAFGNKRSLFKLAVQHYINGPASYVRKAMEEPTARRVAQKLLEHAADLVADDSHPPGCMVVQSALACGVQARAEHRELIQVREEGVAALRKRFARARAQGDLPRHANPGDLARYLATIIHGMAVQASGGAKRSELRRVAAMAMKAWPD